jgi:hypothetical protein
VGKIDQAYFVQRAAEEMAAAERAASAAAATVHRELSLRYSLKIILPEPARAADDARPIGQPKRDREPRPRVTSERRESKRSRG